MIEINPNPERKKAISIAIRKLPLLPEKLRLIDEATNEIVWAAMLPPPKLEKERDNDSRRSVATARVDIGSLIASIDNFLTCASNLSHVAVRSIDRETTPDVYADDIGYVNISNTRLFMGALRDKANDAMSELPEVGKPRGRPHKNGQAENVTDVAGRWYEEMTGKEVTRINDAYSGVSGSPFTRFLDEVFIALGMQESTESLTKRSKEKKTTK